MQTSLLESLYGNLPAPKASCSSVSATTKESQEEDSSCKPPITDQKQNEENTDESYKTPLEPNRYSLLLPPPLRRRDTNVKKERLSNVFLNPCLKPTKEASKKNQVVDELPSCKEESSQQEPNLSNVDTNSHTLPQKIVNEYDPSKPNSYEEFVKERARYYRRKEEERRQKEEMERLREEQKLKAASAATQPSLAISGDEAWKRRKQLTTAIFGEQPNTPQTDLSTNQPIKKGRGFAEKMLEKMGWKHGEGLGKEKQGIVAPLVARKTDKHSGVIIQGNAVLKSSSLPPPSTVSVPSYSMDQVSRIVLLTNLVGPGQVDTDLKSETTEEAAKFGNLLSVNIIQVPNVPEHETVQIFCEYESHAAAMKGMLHFISYRN